MKVWKPQTAYSLGREAGWSPLMAEISACATVEAVEAWWSSYVLHRHRDMPEGWSLALRDACEVHADELMAGAHHAELDRAFASTMGGAV